MRIATRYFAELKAGGAADEEIAAIRRYGTPVLRQHINTKATRAAIAGIEGARRDHRLPRHRNARFVGAVGSFRLELGARRQD